MLLGVWFCRFCPSQPVGTHKCSSLWCCLDLIRMPLLRLSKLTLNSALTCDIWPDYKNTHFHLGIFPILERFYDSFGVVFDGFWKVAFLKLDVSLFLPVVAGVFLWWLVRTPIGEPVEIGGFLLVELASCISEVEMRFWWSVIPLPYVIHQEFYK